MTYNRFIQGLREAGVEVDRKILADLAVNDPAAFAALVEVAKANVPDQARREGAGRDRVCLTAPMPAPTRARHGEPASS